jgi:hypothetical protein
VATVLALFLICSGAGSAWSDRLAATRASTAGVALTIVFLLAAVVLLRLVHVAQPLPILLRAALAAVILAPAAFVMGIPFPVGLRALAGDDRTRVGWAWAANGFSSVIAAPLAALIALAAGSPTLFIVAAASYGVAAVLGRVDHAL